MKRPAVKKPANPGLAFSAADGHQLAADMLRDVYAGWQAHEKGIPDELLATHWRHADSAVLRRYLDTVKAKGCAELERGFYAVITHFIGCSVSGVVPSPEVFDVSDKQ